MINIEKFWDKVSDNASETLNLFLEECLDEANVPIDDKPFYTQKQRDEMLKSLIRPAIKYPRDHEIIFVDEYGDDISTIKIGITNSGDIGTLDNGNFSWKYEDDRDNDDTTVLVRV